MYISFSLYYGEMTDAMDTFMTKLIDSAYFDSPKVSETLTPFYDDESGVSFTVPAGWGQDSPSTEWEYAKLEFANGKGNILAFGYTDIWSKLSYSEKKGHLRVACSNSAFSNDDIIDIFMSNGVAVEDVVKESFWNIEYFKIVYNNTDYGTDNGVYVVLHVMIYDGYAYCFSFIGDEDSTAYDDYLTLLSSVKYDNLSGFSGVGKMKFDYGLPANSSALSLVITITLNLIATVLIYSLPIIIYRYGIIKAPVPKAKAKNIVIIYGICAFIIVMVIGSLSGDYSEGGAVIFWSYINYAILKGGKSKASPIPCYAGSLEGGGTKVGA